jgi:hypothetical protein
MNWNAFVSLDGRVKLGHDGRAKMSQCFTACSARGRIGAIKSINAPLAAASAEINRMETKSTGGRFSQAAYAKKEAPPFGRMRLFPADR